MAWYNIEIEEAPADAGEGVKLLTLAYKDDDLFRDSPLVVQIQSRLDDHENIKKQCEEQLAAAYEDAANKLDDKGAILEMLNAQSE